MKPTVFIHIPKTAGSTWRELLIPSLPTIKELLSGTELTDEKIIDLGSQNWSKIWGSKNHYLQQPFKIDWRSERVGFYYESLGEHTVQQMAHSDMWDYWVNEVKDKSSNVSIIS